MDEKVKKELKTALPGFLSLTAFFLGSFFAIMILPENCKLFGNPEGLFMCDSIPNDCCGDMMRVTYAQIIFGLGIGLSIAPFILLWKKEEQKQSETELKIFEKSV